MNSPTANDKLVNALESCDFQTALPLLPKDGPLITIGPEGFTPLHYACRHGEAKVTRLLITQYHYSIKSTSNRGLTPAHVAVKYGHVDTLRVLVESTSGSECGNGTDTSTATSVPATVSDINSLCNQEGNTPLHTATACGQLPVVQYLIHDLQCSPACTNLKSETPLHLAAKNGHLGVVKFLLDEVGCPTSPVDEYGGTPLYTAARHGQIEVVQYLVEGKACDPNVRTKKRWEGEVKGAECGFAPGRTPLHTASRKGHLNIVHYLVNVLKCDPSCRDENGVTPLHLASQEGHLAIVKFLVIECQCDPSVAINNGRTPLHSACWGGSLDLVQYLINEHQVDPSCQDENGCTALHFASKNGHLTVVQYLTEKRCNPLARNKDGNTAVRNAALNGRLDVLKFFITEKGCDPMVRGQWNRTLVHDASQEGHLETVQYLINEHQVDPSCQDESGVTPLHLASMNGHLVVVCFLTDVKGCDPLASDKYGNTPVSFAARKGKLDVVKLFITEKGCDPAVRDIWGQTFLHYASDHLETLQYLINEHHLNPSCQNEDNNTALHIASMNGHLAAVHFLTVKGCDPLARNKDGNSPVTFAAFNGRLDVLKFFITEKGCDPMVRGQLNRALVHSASEGGHLETVEYLINEHQVDPSCQDEDSDTPLHLASRKGHLAVVRFLTEKESIPTARNKCGNTPVHDAALNGRLDVLKFFITEKGSDPMLRGQWNRTFIHMASQEGHLETVQYLLNEHLVDPSCQDGDGETPLHLASLNGHLAVVVFLTMKGCSPYAENSRLDTPIHNAVFGGYLSVVKFFISKKRCNPMVRGNADATLLHCASEKGHIDIVQYFVTGHQVNASQQDIFGIKPLHLASKNGHLEVVRFLVEKASCDPFETISVPLFQNTPMSLAAKYKHDNIVLYLHSKGLPIPKSYTTSTRHLDLRVKIYCIGNQSMGKSTLVKALCSEAAWLGSIRKVRDVAPETAGIVPFEFDSGIYGKVTFYDFAGHKEYYSSHEVVFAKASHIVILLTVNVSDDDDTIWSNLRFWKQFLTIVVSASGCQAHIIIVGSHADLVSSQLKAKSSVLLDNFESTPSLRVVDSVLLDCRKLSSSGMSKLRWLLKMTCKKVRIQSQFDYQKGGILHGFIENNLKDETVLTFSELLSKVTKISEVNLEPLKSSLVLYQTCESLNISGHILLLEDSGGPKESWIILRKDIILSQIHGLLKHMKQSSELGMIPLSLIESLLQKHAQDFSPDLAISYMKKVALCSEVDTQALGRIKDVPQEALHTNEKYFFFSSLVSVEKPSQVRDWNPEQSQMYTSGWYLKCINPDHFFTPRFLHVLLIDLACQFALKVNPNSPVLVESKQGCIIWKNGIRWLDPCGIEVIAEVDRDGKSLRLMLKSLERIKLQCTYLRSTLIHLILKLKRKLCGELELKEYFIHPMYFERSAPSQYTGSQVSKPRSPQPVLIQMSEVASALLKHEHQIVVDQVHSEGLFLSIDDLLYFESYQGVGLELLQALYNPHNQQKVIEDPVFEKLAEALHVHWECIAIALKTRQSTVAKMRINDRATENEKCLEVFRGWSGGKGTYSALRHDLDQYSIFRGRNLLDFCSKGDMGHELELQQQEPLVVCSTPAHNLLTESDIGAFLQLIDPNPLGIESLLEVRTEVVSVVAHSTDLGLALGLHQEPTIHVLERENQQDIARQFTEIIAAWLRGADQAGTPSWRSLTKALIAPTVDCPLIARSIAERHPSSDSEQSPVRDADLQFIEVDASPLDESSVDILAETLVERSHLWFHLGLVFGLSYGRLKAIQVDTISSKDRLVKILHSWLCLRDQVLQQGQPSWRTLVRALTHPLVDEMRLAKELAETHKVHVGESGDAATPVPLSSSDPSHPPPSHSTASST